jgi:hypothetical protein
VLDKSRLIKNKSSDSTRRHLTGGETTAEPACSVSQDEPVSWNELSLEVACLPDCLSPMEGVSGSCMVR